MPNEEFARLKRPVEKRGREDEELQKKKMAEFRSDSLDELLANFEFARVKEYVEKRSREAAQAQVTVTPVDTVQCCSPCPLNPDMPSDVCIKFKSIEGKMCPEQGELESSSAGTGLKTPGQKCPQNEGIWETGRTTANGFLTAGVGSSQWGNISSPTERAKSRATIADISSTAATPENAGTIHLAKRTSSSTPVEKERRYRLGTRP